MFFPADRSPPPPFTFSVQLSCFRSLSVGIGGCRPIDLLIITVIVPLDRLLDIIGFVKVVDDDDDSGEVEAAVSVSVAAAAAPGGGQF